MSFDISDQELGSVLWKLLQEEKYEDAVTEINSDKHKTYLSVNSLEIVPIITKFIDETSNEECVLCTQQLLKVIAQKANVKECLLVFLEEIELSTEKNYLYMYINPLKVLLQRMVTVNTKFSNFSWAFNTLYVALTKTTLPEDLNLERKEILLFDSDPVVQKILNLLSHYIEFYRQFCDDVVDEKLSWTTINISSHEYLSCFLLQILKDPLTYLHFEKGEETESSLHRRCKDIVALITKLISNPCKLLRRINENSINIKENEGKEDHHAPNSSIEEAIDFESLPKHHVPQLSFACYFYCIFGENMFIELVPCVYAPDYIFLKLLPLVNRLVVQKRYAPKFKGIILVGNLIKRLNDEILGGDTLEVSGHSDFPHYLIQIMTICDNQDLRKQTLTVFRSYLKKFNSMGRFKLIVGLLSTVKHSGVAGLLIHEIKENVNIENLGQRSSVFSSENLKQLIKLACHLPEEEKTDLLEWNDMIMSALNLLLFISIKDPNDKLKIKDLVPFIKSNYLELLIKGLELSRAHYKLKLSEMKDDNKKKKVEVDTSVTVGGMNLPSISPEQERQVMQSALCTFDMMHSVIARVEQHM